MAVVPHKQIFHCFVCGTGGDVFTFVEKYHKMGRGEVLRMLAQRAGIKLPELPGRGPGPQRDKEGLTPRERIAKTNEWACAFFERHLRTPQGQAGLDYLHSRGLTDDTITRFRLGMSPDGWTGLVNAAMRLGVTNEALFEAGLIKQRQDSSPYDAFRNRVIFPIIDASGGGAGGRVIAFGGRILVEKRDEAGNVVEAKYLNSPDSKLFNKSESLYGLNLARQHIIRTRTAIVVEGYMDVIACHQAGVTNVIATLGTALTPDHARILKNYAQTVVLVFDSDDAGRRATDRALEVFVRGSLEIKLTNVPDGKDPCDFCMKNGGEPFQKLVDAATDALTHKWQQLQTQFHGTDSVTARQEAVTTYLRFVAAALEGEGGAGGGGAAIDPVRRGLLMAKIGRLVNMSSEDLHATLKKLAQQGHSAYRPPASPAWKGAGHSAAGPPDPSPPSPAQNQPPMEGYESPPDTGTISAEDAPPARLDMRTLKGLDAAEGWLLGALLVEPPLFGKIRSEVSLTLFHSLENLATALLAYFDNHAELADCTLPEILHALRESGGEGESGEAAGAELVRQAIELEAKTADWLEPANLSPQHAKLLQNLTKDRGLTLESLVRDSLKELQAARWAGATTDPQLDAEFGAAEKPAEIAAPPAPPDEADLLKEIQQIQRRNTTGGNRRVTG